VDSEDNAFYQCTISASNTITDNGKRTTWFGGKSSAFDYLVGYTINPNDTSAKVGDSSDIATLWSQINGKQLNLAENYDAVNLKTNLADAQPGFALKTTGVMRWSDGTNAYDAEVFRGAAGGNLRCGANWEPSADNTRTLGSASYRWSVVYAATGAINTSDAREKQDIESLDAAEKRVAIALKGLVKKFRFKDAFVKKGEDARIHVGLIVQEVIAAFEAEGLDAMRYAIICYDEWEAQAEEHNEKGIVTIPAREAGNLYGIRYEELLAFIIGAI
jgi:hypothetical protein